MVLVQLNFKAHVFLPFAGLVSEYQSEREKRAVPVNGARIQFQLGFESLAMPILQGSLQGEKCSRCTHEVTPLGRG